MSIYLKRPPDSKNTLNPSHATEGKHDILTDSAFAKQKSLPPTPKTPVNPKNEPIKNLVELLSTNYFNLHLH